MMTSPLGRSGIAASENCFENDSFLPHFSLSNDKTIYLPGMSHIIICSAGWGQSKSIGFQTDALSLLLHYLHNHHPYHCRRHCHCHCHCYHHNCLEHHYDHHHCCLILRAFLELCDKVGGEVAALGPMVDKAFKVFIIIKMLLLIKIEMLLLIKINV